jgi:putative oxidoreductase
LGIHRRIVWAWVLTFPGPLFYLLAPSSAKLTNSLVGSVAGDLKSERSLARATSTGFLKFSCLLHRLFATPIAPNERQVHLSTADSLGRDVSHELDLELLIMRVACALPFIYHGCAILFGAFGGPGPQGFAAFMHYPVVIGYLVGLAQFAGGIAILTGALLRVGAVCVIIVMLGAIFIVHLPHGYDIGRGGLEYALTEMLLALGLLLAGPGKYSLASILPAPLRKL